MKKLESLAITGFAGGGGQTEFEPYPVTRPVESLVTKLRKRTTNLGSFFIGNAFTIDANPNAGIVNFPLPQGAREKRAFTLAEVLITLGIIGIVATLTLPTLQQKMENRSLRSQFLKQYRNMVTVMNEIQSEKGVAYECGNNLGHYTTTECSIFWKDFFKKYRILKTCDYRSSGCAVIYKKKADVLAQGGSINNANCSFLDNYPAVAYTLVDGSIIYTTTNQGGMFFATDVNGIKGPNRWGYDMFYMTIDTSKGQVRVTDAICSMWEKGGRRVLNMLLDTNDVSSNPLAG